MQTGLILSAATSVLLPSPHPHFYATASLYSSPSPGSVCFVVGAVIPLDPLSSLTQTSVQSYENIYCEIQRGQDSEGAVSFTKCGRHSLHLLLVKSCGITLGICSWVWVSVMKGGHMPPSYFLYIQGYLHTIIFKMFHDLLSMFTNLGNVFLLFPHLMAHHPKRLGKTLGA